MIIAALLLAALSLEAQVFPGPLCENFPEVTPGSVDVLTQSVSRVEFETPATGVLENVRRL